MELKQVALIFLIGLVAPLSWGLSKKMPQQQPQTLAPSQEPARPAPAPYDLNDQSCVVGKDSRRELATQFNRFSEPATLKFKQFILNGERPTCSLENAIQPSPSQVTQASDLAQVAEQLRDSAFPIKMKCVLESLKIETGIEAQDYQCTDEKATPKSLGSNTKQCYTQPMVDYIHQSVENSMGCVNSLSSTQIDPVTIFKQINNESTFKINLASSMGNGLGQLTSAPLYDLMNSRSAFGPLLQSLDGSTDPRCAELKTISQEDRKTPLRLPKNIFTAGICKYLSPGQGVQRNLLYSFMLHSYLKSRVIKAFKNRFPKLSLDSPSSHQLIEQLTMVGYGPRGLREAFGILGSSGNISQMIGVAKNNSYIRVTESKYDVVLKNINGPQAKKPEERNAACLVQK